jgi:hypothetical protein
MSQLVQIKSATDLTSEQTAFNNQIQKIDKIRLEISKLKERLVAGQKIYQDKLLPFESEWINLKRNYIDELFDWYQKPYLSPVENKKLAWIIRQDISLIEFYFENDSKLQSIKNQLITTSIDTLTELTDYEVFERQHREARKTQKQAKQVSASTDATVDITKMIKKLYLSLVKNLHPDLEHDEEQRHHKTEVMKQITTSYSDNDVYQLLQLHSQHITNAQQQALNQLSDSQLSEYNKLLQKQFQTLSNELKQLKELPVNSFFIYLASGTETLQNQLIAQYQAELKHRNDTFINEISTIGSNMKEFRKYLKSKDVANDFYDQLD